jgi:drug/metabolite transporter (DMT)-like permease
MSSHYEPSLLLTHPHLHHQDVPAYGTLFCLASAAAFGAMGVVGKLAYGEGATVGTLLAVRFVLAAALFWLLLACTGRTGALGALSRRDVGIAVALGAVGYGAQAGAAFAALDLLDPALFSLLLYVYPVLVTVAAIALGRERGSRRTTAALVLASSGLVLVLAGASGTVDAVGALLAFVAAAVYTVYILSSQGIAGRVDPLVLSTLLCTGAATTLTLGALATGDLHPASVSATGFGWLGMLALVSTVGAITLFFAGLRRVGPSAAAILSTFEPVVTVGLAFVVFGGSLGAAQLAGGALVLGAVLAVRAPGRIDLARPSLAKEPA